MFLRMYAAVIEYFATIIHAYATSVVAAWLESIVVVCLLHLAMWLCFIVHTCNGIVDCFYAIVHVSSGALRSTISYVVWYPCSLVRV